MQANLYHYFLVSSSINWNNESRPDHLTMVMFWVPAAVGYKLGHRLKCAVDLLHEGIYTLKALYKVCVCVCVTVSLTVNPDEFWFKLKTLSLLKRGQVFATDIFVSSKALKNKRWFICYRERNWSNTKTNVISSWAELRKGGPGLERRPGLLIEILPGPHNRHRFSSPAR